MIGALIATIAIGYLIFQEETIKAERADKNLFLSGHSARYVEGQVLMSYNRGNEKDPPDKDAVSGRESVAPNKYYEIIDKYDWNTQIAYEIMKCESSKDPEAWNKNHRTGDNSWGLFQINIYGYLEDNRPPAEWLVVPENNIQYAYELYEKDGWKPWTNCYNLVTK